MSLNIHVNDSYRIVSDPYNVIIQRKVLVDPTKSAKWEEGDSTELKEEFRTVSYHPTVDKALNALVERYVRESDAESLQDLRNEMDEIKGEISRFIGV